MEKITNSLGWGISLMIWLLSGEEAIAIVNPFFTKGNTEKN
ncbi:hypothetical protein [Xenococcus sp. PCC 7305]|nr:hypothetical protein [Xenococcus sp. PCC 7305]